MSIGKRNINLLLVADNPAAASMLQEALEARRVDGVIRRVPAAATAIECARQSGSYRDKAPPDLILFDFTEPTDENTAVLRDLAFSEQRTQVPIVLLINARSQQLLDAENLHDNNAIMFSPTRLSTFISKLGNKSRGDYFKALATLYQYGPILVELPPHAGTSRSKASIPGATVGKHFCYA